MRNLVLPVALALASSVSGLAFGADMKLSKYPKVFKGEEGVSVTLVQVMPETENKALVKVDGIDDEIDGKVFLHDIEIQGQAQAFVIQVDGESRTRLRAGEGYWYKQYELYLPNTTKSHQLYYDEKASKKVNGQSLLAQYQKSDKALQAKRAKFDRKANESYQLKELAKIDAGAAKSCGSPIKTTIVWSSIDDKTLMKYSIHSYCGEVSDRLDSLCRDKADVKANAKKIAKVTCKFGPKLKLTRSGDTVNLDVEPETGNQEDFVQAFLQNEL